MISSLNGKLLFKDSTTAVIECGGIGFKCFVTANACGALPKVGENAFLYTFLSVKEDALDLYGFSSNEELEVFKLITSVSGVGPKIGLAVLTALSPDKVILSIASGDAKALTAASGVGLKLAQRVILELKDKICGVTAIDSDSVSAVNNSDFSNSSSFRDAVEALVSLGYSQSDAYLAVGKHSQDMTTDELIKTALKELSRRTF